jgi:hypothetical protein
MKPNEMTLSRDIVQLLRMNRFFCFHPSNESRRTIWEQAQFKANGGMAGASDLIIVLHGEVVFVELKFGGIGRQSQAQKEFQEQVEKRGHRYLLWRTIDDAAEFINREKSKR